MAAVNCTNEDKYISKDGRCCDRCHAGSYMKAECDSTKATECEECGRGLFTATKNHMNKCRTCRDCSSNSNQIIASPCTAQKDTVCGCKPGSYCSNESCDHCTPATHCSLGEGVKVQANHTIDTICVSCEDGTYSNVSDFHSPCQKHTRCEDIGRVLKTPGTRTTDASCGDFKYNCQWMLPAGLWSGLVLTAFVLFALICWRKKRTSYRAGLKLCCKTASQRKADVFNPMTASMEFNIDTKTSSDVPVTLVDVLPAAAHSLPFASTEIKSQGSCTVDGCDLSFFEPDDKVVNGDTQDRVDSCLPITPLKPSVSFAEYIPGNGSTAYCTGTFLRTYSEPQEDEWCGT